MKDCAVFSFNWLVGLFVIMLRVVGLYPGK